MNLSNPLLSLIGFPGQELQLTSPLADRGSNLAAVHVNCSTERQDPDSGCSEEGCVHHESHDLIGRITLSEERYGMYQKAVHIARTAKSCREDAISANVKTIVVPQIKSKHLVVHSKENERQIVFITKSMKITSLQRAAVQMFPATYMPTIESFIENVDEGGIFHDSNRFYVVQAKPDKKLLVENIQQIIAYLILHSHLCPSKRLFYISNGDPSWDAASFIHVLREDFHITHYICATQKNLPIPEDPSKFFPTKTNQIREVKAQSRGERGLQRRYVPGDNFMALNKEQLNLEIEAEANKQDYLKQKKMPERRHYHTKKAPGSEAATKEREALSTTTESTVLFAALLQTALWLQPQAANPKCCLASVIGKIPSLWSQNGNRTTS
ncbi:unnamed protein product [Bemisia tabaci]|uniref:Uncharacterized protein n=1 Tax=Bemisia tabaci TaxID=7038 RepID=A0A9P0A5G6_BEMTA|nr:unnamed protein product [Bemisia tabaci]